MVELDPVCLPPDCELPRKNVQIVDVRYVCNDRMANHHGVSYVLRGMLSTYLLHVYENVSCSLRPRELRRESSLHIFKVCELLVEWMAVVV